MARRPEHEAPADIYYSEQAAAKYFTSSRIQDIQKRMSRRALELLNLPEGGCHILDIGCGTGLSGEVLEEASHTWVGVDISINMLRIARRHEEESDEDDEEEDEASPTTTRLRPPQQMSEVICSDMGDGLPFRPGVFDGAISISAIQWLCNIDRKGQVPQRRLRALFQSLYNCLRRGARAVLQFYPESPAQMDMINNAAMRCGFGGGMVVDYPHSTRARKCYLVIYAGNTPAGYVPPQPILGDEPAEEESEGSEAEEEGEEGEEGEECASSADDDGEESKEKNSKDRILRKRPPKRKEARSKRRRRLEKEKQARPQVGTKEWVLLKKEQRRQRGLPTTNDSKYTHRKRKPKW